jgi:hypothetical protein
MNTNDKPVIPVGWTKWAYDHDNPHPENKDTLVNLMFRDGTSIIIAAKKVRWNISSKDNFGNWLQIQDDEDIVAYKVVEN